MLARIPASKTRISTMLLSAVYSARFFRPSSSHIYSSHYILPVTPSRLRYLQMRMHLPYGNHSESPQLLLVPIRTTTCSVMLQAVRQPRSTRDLFPSHPLLAANGSYLFSYQPPSRTLRPQFKFTFALRHNSWVFPPVRAAL
ncbi:hypothetical protein OBBRIDRAFT_797359 [Obba rivulosa]|uniref:Uncharacterized protein n=1 Tax=Obba rivulosa TaxID=1052685 RepID=A0A8E2AVR5_9APHY|nr:hypothetical protein OBBRIDRAFT_797359 [Obba rivulosa]